MKFGFWFFFFCFLNAIFYLSILFFLSKFQTDIFIKYQIAKENEILSVIEILIWSVSLVSSFIVTFFLSSWASEKFYFGAFDD
jgi:hypothetical protein